MYRMYNRLILIDTRRSMDNGFENSLSMISIRPKIRLVINFRVKVIAYVCQWKFERRCPGSGIPWTAWIKEASNLDPKDARPGSGINMEMLFINPD
jgi:hypothetical protein